jgi:hypothetical protein
MNKVYKAVLRQYEGELTSLEPPCKSLRVIYPIGDWARAPIGGLVCFDNLFNAYTAYSKFRWYLFGDVEIWESLGSGTINLPVLRFKVFPLGSDPVEERYVKQLWDGSLDRQDPMWYRTDWWPKGTVGFEAVSLQRPVLTRAWRSDERELSGRAYELAREVINEIVRDPWNHGVLHRSLWFVSRRALDDACVGSGPITVNQGLRAVSYGIEQMKEYLVEPLFYELVEFTSKGE